MCVCLNLVSAETEGKGGSTGKEQETTSGLMAFPQGCHFLQLTVKGEEPQGSSYKEAQTSSTNETVRALLPFVLRRNKTVIVMSM